MLVRKLSGVMLILFRKRGRLSIDMIHTKSLYLHVLGFTAFHNFFSYFKMLHTWSKQPDCPTLSKKSLLAWYVARIRRIIERCWVLEHKYKWLLFYSKFIIQTFKVASVSHHDKNDSELGTFKFCYQDQQK